MQILNIVSQLLGLAALIALLWLVVRAFKRSVFWGILVLLLSPIAAIIYAVTFWHQEKKPFLTYITTFVTAIVTGLIVFTSSGGWDVVLASKQVHDGIHDGTLTEEDALKFMRTNMDFIEKTGVNEEDRQKLELMREMLKQMEGNVTEESLQEINEKALAVIENENLSQEERQQFEELRKNLLQKKPELISPTTQQPAGKKPAQAHERTTSVESEKDMDPRAILQRRYQSTKRRHREFRPVELDQAKNHIYEDVIVTHTNGSEQKVTLINITDNKLLFEKRMPGGNVTFEYHDYEIRSLKVLQDVTY